jgi:thiamine biosynthesis protein ThiS
MTITLNGEGRDVPEGSTIHALLAELRLTPDKVAVEVNRRLVRAAGYSTPLKDGDLVEVVTFVGGG